MVDGQRARKEATLARSSSEGPVSLFDLRLSVACTVAVSMMRIWVIGVRMAVLIYNVAGGQERKELVSQMAHCTFAHLLKRERPSESMIP